MAIGIGGAGIRAAKDLAAALPELNVAAIDTDAEALVESGIADALAIGSQTTSNFGTGGDPVLGKNSATNFADEIGALAQSAEILIIISGLGGGTGSMVAPIVASMAHGAAAVVSFTMTPLSVEGAERAELARKSLSYLRRKCDAAFNLPNDIVLARSKLPVSEAFKSANALIVKSAAALVRALSQRGGVNLDLPTFRRIFPKNGECAFLGFGSASGENRADAALEELAASPLLGGDASKLDASNIILSLACGEDFEMNKMQYVLEKAGEKLNVKGRIAFCAFADKSLDGKIEICAMGLSKNLAEKESGESEALSDKSEEPLQKGRPAEKILVSASNTAETPAPAQIETAAAAAAAMEEAQPAPAAEGPAPVPAEPDKPQKKARRGFFGFGRRKTEVETDAEEAKPSKTSQSEFSFVEMSEQRGFFEDTARNIRNGADLDVPTYMRRGIKINL